MIIYKVTNLLSKKIYIGKTKGTLEERRKSHLEYTRQCKKRGIFQNALLKYGFENFTWEIIDSAETICELNEKEKYWIKFLGSQDVEIGYNMTSGGDGGDIISTLSREGKYKPWNKGLSRELQPNFGKVFSLETREKIGKASKNRVWSEERRQKVSPMKGRILNLSPEVKEHKRQSSHRSHLGKTLSKEHREKISLSSKGRVLGPSKFKGVLRDEEVKRKISLSNSGKTRTEEQKLYLSELNKQKPIPSSFLQLKTCPYCKNEFRLSNYKRWHGENCKQNNI